MKKEQTAMHLSFLKELFPQYTVELYAESDSEWAEIKNEKFDDPIRVYYEPEDFDIYCLAFATQHAHISEKERLIEYVTSFANAETAAIEFYKDGKNRFGGDIKTALLDDLTYNSLLSYFGYLSIDISNLTFRVRAWDKKYCFDGMFIKDQSGTVQIVKEYEEK